MNLETRELLSDVVAVIGSTRRELLDHTFFGALIDPEKRLLNYQRYSNEHRVIPDVPGKLGLRSDTGVDGPRGTTTSVFLVENFDEQERDLGDGRPLFMRLLECTE